VADVKFTVDAEIREPDTTSHHSIQEAEPDNLAGCESETYGNRIHCCLVVSPAGRPLHAYRSVGELLEVLRDAIQGHKSLLEDGKILHRDISENNIIITEAATKGDPKGMLTISSRFSTSSHGCAFAMVTKMLEKLMAHVGQRRKRQGRDRYL
jgi:hypothetical protein